VTETAYRVACRLCHRGYAC